MARFRIGLFAAACGALCLQRGLGQLREAVALLQVAMRSDDRLQNVSTAVTAESTLTDPDVEKEVEVRFDLRSLDLTAPSTFGAEAIPSGNIDGKPSANWSKYLQRHDKTGGSMPSGMHWAVSDAHRGEKLMQGHLHAVENGGDNETQSSATWVPAGFVDFTTAEAAQVRIQAGPLSGGWIYCTVNGRGSKPGTYHITVGGKDFYDVPIWGMRHARPTPHPEVYHKHEMARLNLPESDKIFPWIQVLILNNASKPGTYDVKSNWRELYNIPASFLRKQYLAGIPQMLPP